MNAGIQQWKQLGGKIKIFFIAIITQNKQNLKKFLVLGHYKLNNILDKNEQLFVRNFATEHFLKC